MKVKKKKNQWKLGICCRFSAAVCVALILLFLFHNELEVLRLGEETAQTLGLPVDEAGGVHYFWSKVKQEQSDRTS